MRQIKFRIYDNGRKQWLHDTAHAISLFGETIVLGEILRRPDDTTVSLLEMNDLVAMQFTGMFDKSDREIFEGDVLATPHFLDVNGWRYLYHVVEWSDKYTGWWCRNVASEHEADGNIQLWVYAKKEFEIIGNIFDNPELDSGMRAARKHSP